MALTKKIILLIFGLLLITVGLTFSNYFPINIPFCLIGGIITGRTLAHLLY